MFETVSNIINKANKIDNLEKLLYFISHTAEFRDFAVRGGDLPYLE